MYVFLYGYAIGAENIGDGVVHYLLSLGGVVVSAGAEKFVEIRKRARRGDSVDFSIERVAYDSPYHGCHGYSEPACEH